jgi:hypothetical protein
MKLYIKKLLREGLLSEVNIFNFNDDINQKLISLIKTGDKDNIELAYGLGKGQKINVDELVKSIYGDLFDLVKGDTIKEKIPFLFSDELDLSSNNLTSLPESIGNLTNLKGLDLGWNKLTSLKGIEKLTNLERLDLGRNGLTSLKGIEKLTNLERLDLGDNKLTSIEGIGNLTNLEWLSLPSNNLTSLPESIGNLTNLKGLDLMYNELTDLPESIGNLTKLEGLDLDTSQISDKEIERIKELLPADLIIYDMGDYEYDSDWDAYDYE